MGRSGRTDHLVNAQPLPPFADEQYYQDLRFGLHMVKTRFNPHGDMLTSEAWEGLLLLPAFKQLFDCVASWQKRLQTRGTWEHVDEWCAFVRDRLRYRNSICGSLQHAFDARAVPWTPPDRPMCMDDLTETATFRVAQRTFGSRVFTCAEQLCKVSGVYLPMPNDRLLSAQVTQDRLSRRATAITQHASTLQLMRRDGRLELFRRQWTETCASSRSAYLREQRWGLAELPHADIVSWLRNDHPQHKKLDRRLLTASILNVHDLVENDNLPQLMSTRGVCHPALFRDLDGRSICFGVWIDALPALKCEGRLVFPPDAPRRIGEPYEMHIVTAEGNKLPPTSFNPCIGIYQLEAQYFIYDFLVSCVDNFLERPPEPNIGSIEILPKPHGQTLLDKSAGLDYASPIDIDVRSVDRLLEDSLEEALDDLWQLHLDAQYWNMRMRQFPQGERIQLLRSTFDRIDLLTALRKLSQPLLVMVTERIIDPDDYVKFEPIVGEAVVALEVALIDAIDQRLQSLRAASWVPTNIDPPSKQLYDMMMSNDPTLRVIGWPTVLRLLTPMAHASKGGRVPLIVMEALDDMSVLAVCLREVQKHYACTPGATADGLADLCCEAWQGRSRPWKDVIDHMELSITTDDMLKLDRLVGRATLALDEKHNQFWAFISKHMSDETLDAKLNAMMQLLRRRPSSGSTQPSSDLSSGAMQYATDSDLSPTRTQIHQTRRHSSRACQGACEILGVGDEAMSRLPCVTVSAATNKQAWDFWHELVTVKTARHRTYRWTDFCRGMAAIGFAMYRQGGSICRFEHKGGLCSLVFHEPKGKVLQYQARSWWLRRVVSHININLES
ncbi:hypothetical protein LTR56_015311 [Elasticomyces elasticus]|nr:hypothetical protein LTR56_015311 [Elasticomyces elasticus]KAK3640409.1 hypothetical protein LTR22_017066 [Elasticomyces elasticus]KAK4913659.1 hypothetical protein LTR49_018073 [Elasticomyces elasticus]KAK5753086.1 hypothetical protein LTS12_016866 [Elasticomyces elasticus]